MKDTALYNATVDACEAFFCLAMTDEADRLADPKGYEARYHGWLRAEAALQKVRKALA